MVSCPPLPVTDAPPRRATLKARDGLELACEWHGPEDGTPLVFAHGFGQTRHAWSGTAALLAGQGYRALAVDGRGHGDSEWQRDGRYSLDTFIDDAIVVARQLDTRPVWIGASLGGLLGLMAQSEAPGGLFKALVLVDITPRWEADGVARIMTFMRARPEGFASLEDAQRAVNAYLPHRAAAKAPQRLAKLLVRGEDGRFRWHWDPRLLDTVAHASHEYTSRLNEAARRLRLPVLLISGGRSDVVSEATIAEFRDMVPQAQHVSIPQATHMVAGDDNTRFSSEIAHYLQRIGCAPA